MASAPRSREHQSLSLSEMWLLMAAITFICVFLGYVIYDAIMATASELLQRLLVISPLLLVIAVHWLSAGSHLSLPMPGSEPGPLYRVRAGGARYTEPGGSPWGVAFVLLLLLFLISYQPSLHGLIF
uniref:Uncharacterized protein n=1 Tax=Fagus sylvatica TaxID=28930 RepID=A0A2N9HHL7_FAGSY